MRASRRAGGLMAVCWLMLATAGAQAQFGVRAQFNQQTPPFATDIPSNDNTLQRYRPRVPQTPQTPQAPQSRGVGGRYLSDLGNTAPSVQKPFVNVEPRPTVSPYVNLGRDNEDLTLPTYQTLVRPFVQQREINERQQLEIQQLNRQFNNARTDFQLQQQLGAGGLRPTGHQVRFMNLAPYYRLPR
ncbi:MAG: hypothetical protein WDZ59_08630 [Pirellulales bacterium]